MLPFGLFFRGLFAVLRAKQHEHQQGGSADRRADHELPGERERNHANTIEPSRMGVSVTRMVDAIVAGAIVVLLVAGFWWTRGGGGVPGGIDDPARQELTRLTPLGDPIPPPGEEQDEVRPS